MALIPVIVACILLAKLYVSHTSLDREIAGAGDVLAGGTLLLALVAAFVALQAYATATGYPNIDFKVNLGDSGDEKLAFLASRLANGWLEAEVKGDIEIRLSNRSSYAARDVAVIVHLGAMALDLVADDRATSWWCVEGIRGVGTIVCQWDGGGDFVIHGKSSRRLPGLSVSKLRWLDPAVAPFLDVEILASPDYRRRVSAAVHFVVPPKSGDRALDK